MSGNAEIGKVRAADEAMGSDTCVAERNSRHSAWFMPTSDQAQRHTNLTPKAEADFILYTIIIVIVCNI